MLPLPLEPFPLRTLILPASREKLLTKKFGEHENTHMDHDIQQLWYADKKIPSVEFYYNDSVQIIDGEGTGHLASIISLTDMVPEPQYLVETETIGDLTIAQSKLKKVD